VLTREQADRLRGLAAAHFARRGTPVTVDGASLRTEDRLLALENLAHLCRSSADDRWPELVESHFTALLAVNPDPGPADRVLRNAYLRLIPDDALPPEVMRGFTYVRPAADGLLEAIALDEPDTVRLLDDRDVAAVGMERLRPAARANLLALPVGHETVRGQGGATLHVLRGRSLFVAGKALVLDEVMRTVLGHEPPDEGALLAVPTRHHLAFHPITDGRVVDAVNDLAGFGLRVYQDNPGSLSPRVYWWHRGALTSLTDIDHATRVFSIEPPEELMTIMRRLHASAS
jgi:hypothetical protein